MIEGDGSRWNCAAICAAALLSTSGCSRIAQEQPRPAASTLSCARAAISTLPAQISDAELHCLAAGLIARRCSVSEAYIASVAKELADVFGAGDAQLSDLRADRAGVQCASDSTTEAALASCCSEAIKRIQRN